MNKPIHNIVCIFLLFIVRMSPIWAQTETLPEVKSKKGIEVHFRFDKSELDEDYMGNNLALERFAHVIDSIGLHQIDSIVIISHSSPEGAYRHNLKLSQLRSSTMRKVIEQRHPEIKELLRVYPGGEAWDQLREYVSHDSRMKQSTIEDFLKIIDSDINVHTKKWRMQRHPVYRYLLNTYYPKVRNSVFCIIYFERQQPIPEIKPLVAKLEKTPKTDHPYKDLPSPVKDKSTHHYPPLLLKTNLIYDAILSPSIEVEYRIAPHWSILADYTVAWWSHAKKYKYYQNMQFGAEARYWLAERKPWHGHYIGMFAGAGYYDFQRGWTGYQGEYIMAGINYGYMFPIGKRLSLDLGIGVGGLTTEYEEYLPMDGHHVYQLTRKTDYFGPLKLRLALTWHIGCPRHKRSVNQQKGGEL